MNVKQLLGYEVTLYVNDGHGKDTPGKRTPTLPNGKVTRENEFNSPTAKKFGKAALKAGFRVIYIAPNDIDVALQVRTDKANADFKLQKKKYPLVPEEKLALWISFHFNAGSGVLGSNAGGVETLYFKDSVIGKKLAQCIQDELVKGTKQANRGIKPRNNLHELEETEMYAVIIEAGFMDMLTEATMMLSAEFQQETALDALRGVCTYLGVKYEASSVPAKDGNI